MAPCLSPYPMVGLDEAWSLMIRETFKTVQSKTCKNTNIEYCDNSIQRLIGSFSSNDAEALRDVPPVRVSIMDGYAVCLPLEVGKIIPLAGASRAGDPYMDSEGLQKDHAIYVTTGGRVLDMYDVVVPVEMVDKGIDHETQKVTITCVEAVGNPNTWTRGRNIREIGSDHQQGSLILRQGEKLQSAELGTLVSCNAAFKCTGPPKVKIIITGNEIIPTVSLSGDSLLPERCRDADERYKIYDAIGPMLAAELKSINAIIKEVVYARDDKNSIRDQLQLDSDIDLVVTTGGVSMGDTDYMKPVIESNGQILFGRVNAKPGLPTTFSIYEGINHHQFPILSLPGNPVSAWVMTQLLLKPLILYMSNSFKHCSGLLLDAVSKEYIPYPIAAVAIIMDDPIRASPDGRLEFQRCIVYSCPEEKNMTTLYDILKYPDCRLLRLRAVSTGNQKSSRLMSLVNSNGLVIVPSHKSTGVMEYPSGTEFNAFLIGDVKSVVPERYPEPIGDSSTCACSNAFAGSTQTRKNRDLSQPEHNSLNHQAQFDQREISRSRIGILVVSDTVSQNHEKDRSGATAVEWFKNHKEDYNKILNCDDVTVMFCPDVVSCIQEAIIKLACLDCALIITSGGTGLGPRDVTPQAILSMLESRCLGLEHLIISTGLKHTRIAALSSPIVGKIKTKIGYHLVVSLPGSPAAVGESLDGIGVVLRHAIQIMRSN